MPQQKATSSRCLIQQSTDRLIIFNYNYDPVTCYKRVNKVQGQSENFPFPSLGTHRRSWWAWFSWKSWFASSALETKKLQQTFINAVGMDSFGIRILRKDLIPYVLAKKTPKPQKPNKIHPKWILCISHCNTFWVFQGLLLIVITNYICISIPVTMSHFKALSQIWEHIDWVINKVPGWDVKKLHLYEYTGAWAVKLCCSTVSTYVQHNPINKHTYLLLWDVIMSTKARDLFAKTTHLLCAITTLCVYIMHMQNHLI